MDRNDRKENNRTIQVMDLLRQAGLHPPQEDIAFLLDYATDIPLVLDSLTKAGPEFLTPANVGLLFQDPWYARDISLVLDSLTQAGQEFVTPENVGLLFQHHPRDTYDLFRAINALTEAGLTTQANL